MNASASGDGRARARDADHYGCLARGTSSWTTSVTLRSLRAALCLRPPMPAVTSMSGTSNRASVASNYEAGRSRCWRLSSSTSATLPPPDGMSTAGRPSTSGTCEPDELPHCNGSDPGPARKCSTTPSVTPHRPGPGGGHRRRRPAVVRRWLARELPRARTAHALGDLGGAGRTEVVTLVDHWLRGWPRPGLPPATYLNRHHGHPHWTPPRSAGRPCRTSRAGWRAGSVASPAGRPDRTRGRGR